MNNSSFFKFTKQILKLQSHTPSQSEVPNYICSMLKQEGINPIIYSRNNTINIVARTVGDPRILYNGHWDTVLPDESYRKNIIPVYTSKDGFSGLGACDMKSGVASMVYAFIMCHRFNVPGVVLCLVGDEETGGENGTGYLVQKGIFAPYIVLGEPTRLKLSLGQKGGIHLKVSSKGISGHSAYPHKGKNAILPMLHFTRELIEEYPLPSFTNSIQEVFDMVTVSPNVIHGGSANNVVPSQCEMYIDIRIPPHITITSVKNIINKLTKKYDLECDINFLGLGWKLNKKSKLNNLAKTLLKNIIGKDPEYVTKMGTNDGKYYALKKCEIINIGPGDNKLSHTNKEFVSFEELLQAKDLYFQIAKHI